MSPVSHLRLVPVPVFLLKVTFIFIIRWLCCVTSCHRCSLALSTTPSCLSAQALVRCVDNFQPLSSLSMPYSCGQVGQACVLCHFSAELKPKLRLHSTITHFELLLLLKIILRLTSVFLSSLFSPSLASSASSVLQPFLTEDVFL